jgi:hypothetical protein
MAAKTLHFLILLTDLEMTTPARIHAVAAVTPMVRSVVGHKSRYPTVDVSRKNPWTVPPVREATARDPKKSGHRTRY